MASVPAEPLCNMAMHILLRRMGRGGLTVHGFRSTFRDWAAEQTDFPSEVVEMALAHAVGDKVEAAYRRGDLFEKRRQLMDAWAKYCAATATVTSLPTKTLRDRHDHSGPNSAGHLYSGLDELTRQKRFPRLPVCVVGFLQRVEKHVTSKQSTPTKLETTPMSLLAGPCLTQQANPKPTTSCPERS